MLFTNCRFVITQNDAREILEDVDILVMHDEIVEIAPGLVVSHPHEQTIDCSNRIVMPGLINAHMHLGMTALRGASDDEELAAWLDTVTNLEKYMTREELRLSAELGVKEALCTGTTTLVDMYDPRDEVIDVAQSLGARLCKVQSYFTTFATFSEQDIRDSVTKPCESTTTLVLGPHSLYGTNEEMLRVIRKIATEKKLLIHMHLAETRAERAEFKQAHGCLPVEYLERIGFLGPDVILVHATWLTKNELDIIAKHTISVVHCPQSNMKLAGGGVMPLAEMQERNINVCLGTDSTASNNALDMFREMHVCSLLHKHHYWNPTKGDAQLILDMATRNAARAYHRLDLGQIRVGYKADIITLDARDINLQPLDTTRVLSHIVHAANGMNVAEVIVNGKILVREKHLLDNTSSHG